MTTNASMIVIPEWTLMLCHFICKLLSRAVSKKGASETIAVSYDSEQVLTKIRATPTLRKYAAGFFAYCATQNRMPLRSIKNATGLTRPVWVQLLMAVEIFVIGHEYGHHIALHSTVNPLESDPVILKVQELEADHIAALITAHIGAEFRLQFAHCGSAGVIALVGTDMVRRARSVLITGEEAPYLSETHPPLEDRLLMLETLRYDPRQADAVHRTRQHFRSIMEGLWDLILPDLKRMHARGIRPMPVARKDSQWLPFWG
jgi:hypothetical protein